ncbi:hypothetical protein KKH96_03935 [Patescibacteria group bacterium]|nr:hypothetical protein [Patescibacteria group bacterium]
MAEIGEFLNGLSKRLEENHEALIFFKCFLKNSLIEKINKYMRSDSVNLKTDFSDKQSWDIIYHIAAEILWDAACRNHSEVHPNIFKEANDLSLAFCREIEKCLGIDMEFIPIKSLIDEMVEAGLVKVIDGYIEFT